MFSSDTVWNSYVLEAGRAQERGSVSAPSNPAPSPEGLKGLLEKDKCEHLLSFGPCTQAMLSQKGQQVPYSDCTQASLRNALSPGCHMHEEFQFNSCPLGVLPFRSKFTDTQASSLRIHLPSCHQEIHYSTQVPGGHKYCVIWDRTSECVLLVISQDIKHYFAGVRTIFSWIGMKRSNWTQLEGFELK